MSGFLGSGDLYMDRLDEDGNSTGLMDVGNATKLMISEETEIKERISRGRNTYGQTLDSAQIKKPAKIEITLDELNKTNLSIALLGDESVLNVASGSVSGEVVVAKLGKWVQLAKGNLINTSVVVQDETDTTTFVKGTDYQLNLRVGLLQALEGGTISDAQELHVDYDHEAVTGNKISGSTQPTIKARLILDGKNFADGADVILTIDKAVLSPSGGVDFLSDEYTSIELSGSLETLTGQTTPYTVELRQ
ncbi:MAG: hypothetical protein H7832_01430 [Magnetococcus sp. DMHC-6]